MNSMNSKDNSQVQSQMTDLAQWVVEQALKQGAREVSAGISTSQETEIEWREGRVDKMNQAQSRGLGLTLYVDGRYGNIGTSDLRKEALAPFISEGIALVRALAPDPHRHLPDPALYAGQQRLDLQLEDSAYFQVSPDDRLQRVREMEQAARDVLGSGQILSVTSAYQDHQTHGHVVHSNGFSGHKKVTSFWLSTEVTVQDGDGRRPEESSHAGARFLADLPDAAAVGHEAAERAFRRIGSTKLPSQTTTMVVDHRVAARLLGSFLGPASAASFQQKRSFFESKLNQAVCVPWFSVTDDPFIPKGFGSRLFDGEGIAAKRWPILENGVLKNIYVDHYYGQKLGQKVTTGGASNLICTVGEHSQQALLQQVGEGILVTGFLGGNSNGTTGDFSFGVLGFRIHQGLLKEPVGEMNISGNHLELWQHLIACGNDPYPYSALRTPTLVFENVHFAGL